ncbi:MAG TPA: DUF551 domain-containing protein [Agriterribacter sp.]|nr:DUF551 domain-containing protein [Agriterribacter sp.]
MNKTLEMDNVIKCLALELPEPVWNDVNKKWQEFKATLQQSHAVSGEVEELAKAFADSKERRGCSYWSGLVVGFKSGYAAAPKGMRGNIITDEQLDKAWGYANFGTTPKRRVVSEALEKITQGYHNGRTATAIIEELGLVECREKGRYYVLTDLGLKYLRAHEPPDSEAGYGWISVNERLPADNEDYEVWVKGNIIPIIAHYLSKKYFSDNYDDENYMEEGWYYSHAYNFHRPEFTLDVTHWRPLPQPPSNP